jgi:hypothetical protein
MSLIIVRGIHIQLIKNCGSIQTNGAYNNNDNNITVTSVGTTLNNMQNTDTTGGIQHKKT